jgi:hypothetical protein
MFVRSGLYLLQTASVAGMVQPKVPDQEVLEFVWGHMQQDVQALCKVLGRSTDDVCLLLHHLCHSIATNKAGEDR